MLSLAQINTNKNASLPFSFVFHSIDDTMPFFGKSKAKKAGSDKAKQKKFQDNLWEVSLCMRWTQ